MEMLLGVRMLLFEDDKLHYSHRMDPPAASTQVTWARDRILHGAPDVLSAQCVGVAQSSLGGTVSPVDLRLVKQS